MFSSDKDRTVSTTFLQNKPSQRLLVMDLVAKAGVDVSDWGNFKGGQAKAASNPKYCYDWAFVQPGKVVVLNFWYDDIKQENGRFFLPVNLRQRAARIKSQLGPSILVTRNLRMDKAIQLAHTGKLPVRVILLDGIRRDGSSSAIVKKRSLDADSWAVTSYDFNTGECILTRGVTQNAYALHGASSEPYEEELEAFEGEERIRFVRHRKREGKFRARKIQSTLERNGGRLRCEVPSCGFDFFQRYGALGAGYAHVHHDRPLSSAPTQGTKFKLTELKVVCANCHAMIHRGGQCRSLSGLIPPSTSDASPV